MKLKNNKLKNNKSEKFENLKRSKVRKIVSVTMLVICILFIWGNSFQDASASGYRSGKVTEFVNDVLPKNQSVTEQFLRKAAHFTEYLIEGICVVFVMCAFGIFVKRNIGNGLLIGVLTALIDESIQIKSPGRASSVIDIWIDWGGFVVGAAILTGIIIMIKCKFNHNNIKNITQNTK